MISDENIWLNKVQVLTLGRKLWLNKLKQHIHTYTSGHDRQDYITKPSDSKGSNSLHVLTYLSHEGSEDGSVNSQETGECIPQRFQLNYMNLHIYS